MMLLALKYLAKLFVAANNNFVSHLLPLLVLTIWHYQGYGIIKFTAVDPQLSRHQNTGFQIS